MGKKSESKKKAVPVKKESSGLFADMDKRMRQLESRFEQIFSDDWSGLSVWEWPEWAKKTSLELKSPKVDIVDRDNDVLIRADVPGVKKEDIDVTLTDNTVTIKGSTSEEKKEEKGDYYRSETLKGSFTRTMSLPSDVDGSKAESTYKDGVLEVVVPKHEKAKRIKIKVS
jgi:HSP20 family protein